MKRLQPLADSARSLHGDLTAELVADWLGERYTRSVSTGDTYASCLSAYLSWCGEQGVDPVLVRRQEASRFVRWLGESRSPFTGRVRSGSAVNTVLTACARFLEYAVEVDVRPEAGRNPFQVVERPVVHKQPRPGARLSKTDVNRLVLAAREDHVLGATLGKLVVGTLALVGVRPTDVCRLDQDQVLDDGESGYELRLTVKRGKQLTRWMPPVVAADAYTYLQRARREPAAGEGRPFLVHPRLHRRLNRDDVLSLVKRSAVRAGITAGRELTARDFRRYFITAARGAGSDLEDRQRAAGHADARTTGLYDDTGWSRQRDPAMRVAALFEDYPAEELTRPLEHATPAGPRTSAKYECDCPRPWANARVWLGPVGVDEFARIELTEDYEPGTTQLDQPSCPVCHAIYLGPFRVRSVPGDEADELLRRCRQGLQSRALYPDAEARRQERGG